MPARNALTKQRAIFKRKRHERSRSGSTSDTVFFQKTENQFFNKNLPPAVQGKFFENFFTRLEKNDTRKDFFVCRIQPEGSPIFNR